MYTYTSLLALFIFFGLIMTVVYGQDRDAVTIPTDRNALGRFVNRLDYKRGAVIHLLSDESFSTHLLADWTRCQYFATVFAIPNSNNMNELEKLSFQNTKNRIIQQTKSITHTNTQLVFVDDTSDYTIGAPLDFIYLHLQPDDYCTIYQLLVKWWTKLAPRGILSGFHFVDDNTQTDFLRDYKNPVPDDWVFCADKKTTRRAGLVREGVAKFAKERGCAVFTTTEQDIVHSFFIQKPL